MKSIIIRKLIIFTLCIWAVLLYVNCFTQYVENENKVINDALSTISQLERVLRNNTENLETLTESLKEEYIVKAQTVAYILEVEDINTPEEYQELAKLVDVDEIHVFNDQGVIYEGSVPIYYGYNFDSGEQIGYFKAMLDDKELTLCQDITPNTAESKSMMYIATWESSGVDIVQIGIEPERILLEQQHNDIAYVFSNMITDENTNLYAIDSSTGIITGCTNSDYLDLESSSIGLNLEQINTDSEKFVTEIDGINKFCIFQEYGGIYIGYCTNYSVIIQDMTASIFSLSLYFTVATLISFYVLFKLIDLTILRNFDSLTNQVSKIASGDWDTKVNIHASPEFTKLSNNINRLVASLLNSTDNLSNILDYVDTNIAVYEYKKDMNRVFATSKLATLLNLDEDDLEKLLEDKQVFEEKIIEIKTYATNKENIYHLGKELKYLQIENFSNEEGDYGIISDVSELIKEQKKLKRERDYDILTNVYNRRALYHQAKKVFDNPSVLKEAVIMILDNDHLKSVNDSYGHNAGDEIIKQTAAVLSSLPIKEKIIGRLGGDEFVLIIYGQENKEILLENILLLRSHFDKAFISIQSTQIPLTISAGYVFNSDYSLYFGEYLKCADQALYASKKGQRNTFTQYVEQLKAEE